MADSAAAERAAQREEFLAFELTLDDQVSDEVRREDWGRAYLCPTLPLIWDANWVGIERPGLAVEEIVRIADEVLGGEGFAHRTICLLDEADGKRVAEAVESDAASWPGWEVERTRYMAWREADAGGGERAVDGGDAGAAGGERSVGDGAESGGAADGRTDGGSAQVVAREVEFDEAEPLRRASTAELTPRTGPDFEAVVDQLVALDRRYAERAGDRWFVAPAQGEPASACRLFRADGIAQVEDVATLEAQRERGYAKAIVLAAVAAAREAGDETVFLTADAADWPQLMYAKLGFETVGELTVLRRRP
jgi:N-acetylglutamate synthase-like GNAT family acetyltransferase